MSFLSASLLAQTIDDHIAWMTAWARLACFDPQQRAAHAESLPAPESFALWRREMVKAVQDQPALDRLVSLYDQMHRMARLVLLKAPDGAPVPPGDFDSVTLKYQEFIVSLRRMERALASATAGLDALTGLRSRLGIQDDLTRELSRFQRNGKPFCIALMDIDHFKRVNDTYGHNNGDRVLSAVANHVTRSLRPFDDVWRWGGEELLVCLKEADSAGGLAALERVRAGLEKSPIALSDGKSVTITASFGMVCVAVDSTVDNMVEQADKALYRAKAAGRNRIELFNAAG